MTPTGFMIMVGIYAVVILGVMYWSKLEGRYATNYQQKLERKRRLEFAKKQANTETKKEVKKGVEVTAR
jgi:hypothetical protein